ncbi:hypothetical protein [uncultured Acetatifactor sp.]|uniref:hypothetical protein n=1 Tax=uncultured Acetatifactor sp. TaxID=1671927 RepID=UPI0026297D43|nr:hypothetical protein [uncultured Acetatifactor sp.]
MRKTSRAIDFAKEIVRMAEKENITILQFREATKAAIEIAEKNSCVKRKEFYCGELEEMQDCGNSPA